MTLQQQLDEALAARHALLTGKSVVSVGYGERRVEYTKATLKDLDAYIASLRQQLQGRRPVRNRIRYVVPQ